jgi:MFS transporter, MHS family, alpha-ketoglutarate permease
MFRGIVRQKRGYGMVATTEIETAADVRRRLVSIFGGSIGNLIEWYDFYVYNAFALYFAKFFFPNSDPTAQFLNTFGIYALAFFVRPIGSWVIGSYADRKGRRAALTASVMLMCFGSLLIGIIPPYASVGAAAPVLLLLARLVQSLSLGGEYGTSATYLSEVASRKRRGFYSSFQYVTLIGGQILASLVLLVLQQMLTGDQLEAWGWRIPFLLGAACSLYGFYLRRNLQETDDFKRASRVVRPNLLAELAKHPREILLVFGLTMGGTVAFYTYTIYMPTFLVNTVKLSRDQATLISFITLFLYACLQPVFGALSDRIGRRPVLLWFGVMGTLCTVPLLTALSQTRDFTTALLLVMAALVIVSGYTAINAVVKAELFPAGVRALGVGLPYAVAASLFGGTAPYVALWFKQQQHEAWFYWYVSALVFGSLLVYGTMRDTRDASKIEG